MACWLIPSLLFIHSFMQERSKNCRQCQTVFVVTDEDRAFLKKIAPTFAGKRFDIPHPTLCPDCRQQRRITQINEFHLYRRTCDLTGKSIIADIHPLTPYKVYDQEVWYSDKWDAMDYGREFDFKRPFFEQYYELTLVVPHFNLFTGYQYDINCDYTNYAGKNKDCYLIFDADECQDCSYCYSLNSSKDTVDCYRTRLMELCYECVDCLKCYNGHFLQDCSNCRDSAFLKNCIGCSHCLMCSNLQNKEYHLHNRPVSKETFEQAMRSLSSRSVIDEAKKQFAEFTLTFPQKALHGVQNEDVFGDYLTECKNVRTCFDSTRLWDCAYVWRSFLPVKDAMDCQDIGDGELLYECSGVGYSAHNMLFSANCLDTLNNYLYSTFCMHCKDLFGCCGLRHKQYCIFNKQYTKEEYEKTVAKILEHMHKTGEWGEFFPVQHSPFAYNETQANAYYPLTKAEVLARGWQWHEKDPNDYQLQKFITPDAIDAVSDTVIDDVLACRTCKKNYRIITKELTFYRRKNLPLPIDCFDCRHDVRRNKRNPRALFTRTCAKCQKSIKTTYAPERPEIVYCEECYRAAIY